MATANKFGAALLFAAFSAAAPALTAQQPSPAMLMARTVCFDEIRLFETAHAKEGKTPAETSAAIADVLSSFVPASEDRTHALTSIEAIKKSVAGPSSPASDRDQLGFVFCAATVGAAADGGMRDLGEFKAHWASERTGKFKLRPLADPSADRGGSTAGPVHAAPAAPEIPDLLPRSVRRICANELKTFEEDLTASGQPPDAVKNTIDDIVRTFIEDAEPRAQLLDDFDEMARQPGAGPGDLKRLAASACVATLGSLWSVGMRTNAELNSHWIGRGRARFALEGAPAQPTPFSCIWMDWDRDGMNVPGTLRNECTFTVDLRFCMVSPAAGSPSEAIACEKGRSRFERIAPKSGVHTDLTNGTQIRWAACKAPQQPVDTTPPGGTFQATCK